MAARRPNVVMVLACIDRSEYAGSVCDHAAWLAGPLAADVDVLHVEEAAPVTPPARDGRVVDGLLRTARQRLAEHGVQPRHLRLSGGTMARAAIHAAADVTVLGKRGECSDGRRESLGSNAAALVRQATGPLCLVSQLYLPIRRALVLVDADLAHRRTVETAAAHPGLAGLELDVVVLQPDGVDAAPKLVWARSCLAKGTAEVFAVGFGSPDEAAARYLDDHHLDLIVVSRETLLAPSCGCAPPLEARGLWASRAPLFIC